MKNFFKTMCFVGALSMTHSVCAKDFVVNGLTLKTRAYINASYNDSENSRYDVTLSPTTQKGASWDFTFDNNPTRHYTSLEGNTSDKAYKKGQKTARVKLTLHKFQTLDERVTFNNLDLNPVNPVKENIAPRFLSLKKPVSCMTPSGIFIMIPAQKYDFFSFFANRIIHGNLNALFFDVQTVPDQREVVLPESPLYKKYHKPVTIKLECDAPNDMVWYMADNTFKRLAVGMPKLATIKHIDALTFIVRQRVELQSFPVVLEIPIEATPQE